MQLIKYLLIGIGLIVLAGCGGEKKKTEFRYFRNYQRTFNDMNDKHLKSAKQFGIQPITSDEQLDAQSKKLEEISSCRYYVVDELTHSIPYLVPPASELLETIGRNFRDSLSNKGLPSRRIMVTSILRTRASLKKLRTKNTNASANSAHIYGTTFDVAYARFDRGEEEERDKLKSVLAEVLQDLRRQKKCYVRYEHKQGCFHITVR